MLREYIKMFIFRLARCEQCCVARGGATDQQVPVFDERPGTVTCRM